MPDIEHTHEFVLVTTKPDGARIYGCVGCDKTKTVSCVPECLEQEVR